jgi:hypothetical protein
MFMWRIARSPYVSRARGGASVLVVVVVPAVVVVVVPAGQTSGTQSLVVAVSSSRHAGELAVPPRQMGYVGVWHVPVGQFVE